MAKQHSLASPFGPITLRVQPHALEIAADDVLSADWGLGWWHAHEAGDEAVFQRTFWRAELGARSRPSVGRSELDAFIRPWGFTNDLAAEVNDLSAGHRARVQAYAQGFNEGRHRRRGEALWTPEDCHLLVRTLGFLEWWETRAPQVEFFQAAWKAGLSWPRLADLWPGLGPEPDRRDPLEFRASFSPDARQVLDQMRRFRSSPVWAIPASRSGTGHPLLAACYISDVTDPGLPFLSVRIDLPGGRIRGLSRPGHPGFLSGKTANLTWHVAPAVDDVVDLRRIDRETGAVAGVWAGSGHTGTLGALLTLETQPTASQARETMPQGSACLDFTVVDGREALQWALGPRWLRPRAVDAWIPASWETKVSTGPRTPPTPLEAPNKATVASLQSLLSQTRSDFPERALATLRSLLPDTEDGRLLRRWTGSLDQTREAMLFERLYGAVVDAFWESSPVIPPHDSSLAQALAPRVDRLIEAPHSAWFASSDKNRRLAEAVRRAFSPGAPAGPPLLRRRSPYALWNEQLGGRAHVFAATVALVADAGEPGWKLRLTDDETDPSFHSW